MSLGNFLKKCLMNFFIIVTFVSVVIGLLGLIYEPDRQFGYEAYFSPIIFGFIGVLPSIVTYSRRELTIKQMAIRNILQLLVIEILILSFGYLMGAMEAHALASVAFSVFIVYLLVHLISWIIDSKKAAELTMDLKAYQSK